MENNSNYLLRLKRREINALTRVLALPSSERPSRPSPEWLARQQRRVAKLPLYLLSWDLGFITRLWHSRKTARYLRTKDAQQPRSRPNYAILCGAHARLDRTIVRHVFLLVAKEVSVHMAAVCNAGGDDKTAVVGDWEDRMLGVNGLWMTDDQCAEILGRDRLPSRLPRVRSSCEACMLAVVGGRAQVLVDLCASLRGRSRRGRQSKLLCPMLLAVVEAWIDHFGGERADEIYENAEILAGQLRQLRRAQKEKRRAAATAQADEESHQRHRRHEEKHNNRDESSRQENAVREDQWQPAILPEQAFDSPISSFNPISPVSPVSPISSINTIRPPSVMEGRDGSPHGLTQDEWDQLMADNDDDDAGEEAYAEENGEEVDPVDEESGEAADGTTVSYFLPRPRTRRAHVNRYEFASPDCAEDLEASICGVYQRLATDECGRSQVDFSRMHPAFQSFVAPSAVPSPLDLTRNRRSKTPARQALGDNKGGADDKSWVSCSVHTFGETVRAGARESIVPPVPAIPAKYMAASSSSKKDQKGKAATKPRPESLRPRPWNMNSAASSTHSLNDKVNEPVMPPAQANLHDLPQISPSPPRPPRKGRNRFGPETFIYPRAAPSPPIVFTNPFADRSPNSPSDRRRSATSSAISPRTRPPPDEHFGLQDQTADPPRLFRRSQLQLSSSSSPTALFDTRDHQDRRRSHWQRAESIASGASDGSSRYSGDSGNGGDAWNAAPTTITTASTTTGTLLRAIRAEQKLALERFVHSADWADRPERQSDGEFEASNYEDMEVDMDVDMESVGPDDSASRVAERLYEVPTAEERGARQKR